MPDAFEEKIHSDKAAEMRLRRKAQRQGLILCKSRDRSTHADNRGGYQIVHAHLNTIEAGEKFDLDLDDVERFLVD